MAVPRRTFLGTSRPLAQYSRPHAPVQRRIALRSTSRSSSATTKRCSGCRSDIEVNVTGGYDPNTTPADARLIKAEAQVYRASGIEPIYWPRRGGSPLGYVFTSEPLKYRRDTRPGAWHARSRAGRYDPIESQNPKVSGLTARFVRTWIICTRSRESAQSMPLRPVARTGIPAGSKFSRQKTLMP